MHLVTAPKRKSRTRPAATSPEVPGGGGSPLGEVNAAMDASDTRHMARPILLCLLVLFAALIRPGHALEIGERVGPLELATLDGRWLTMTNYPERRGTVVVFLSARGGAAQEEMRALGELNTVHGMGYKFVR